MYCLFINHSLGRGGYGGLPHKKNWICYVLIHLNSYFLSSIFLLIFLQFLNISSSVIFVFFSYLYAFCRLFPFAIAHLIY